MLKSIVYKDKICYTFFLSERKPKEERKHEHAIFHRPSKKRQTKLPVIFFLYCPLGAVCPLIGQYLSSIGFSGTQVGIVTSGGTAAAVIASMIWGTVYANSAHKRRLIALIFLAAGTFAVLTLSTTDFLLYAVLYAAMYMFQGPVHGLCDSFVMENQRNYPVVRSFGAVGYSVAVYFAGNYAEKHGLETIFYIYAITFFIAAIIVMGEKEPPYYGEKGERISIRELLSNRKYLELLVCSFFVFGCAMGNSTYFGYLFRSGGGSLSGIGLAFLLMAGSETVFMLLIPILNRKIPTEKLTLAAIAVCGLRFAFYATGPSYKVLLGTFFLQGMSNGIIWVEFVKYFGKVVEPRLSSIAVSVFYAIGNNLSTIMCSLAGGILLDLAGARGSYIFFALCNGLACVLYLIFGLHKAADKEKQCT